MRTDEDETEEDIYHDACFATGMCCLKLASEGGEINRERLAIKLMRLLGAVIEKTEECPSSLLFAIEQPRGEPDSDVDHVPAEYVLGIVCADHPFSSDTGSTRSPP